MRKKPFFGLIVLSTLVLSGAPIVGQVPPPVSAEAEPLDEELSEAIRRHFLSRLRVELGLTDDQMESVAPLVADVEQTRTRFRRERMQTARALHRGMEEGAGDAELQKLLDRLTSIEVERQTHETELLSRIDAQLTVRQRVQLRFYTERFRRNLERRIDDLRRERRDRRDRDPLPPRRPPAENP